MKTDEHTIIQELLGDQYTQMVLKELGIQESAPAVQAELLGFLGSNILKRLALEILTVLPAEKHEEFAQFIGSGDAGGMRALVEPYIPNYDEFILQHANMEYEATKTQMRQLQQLA